MLSGILKELLEAMSMTPEGSSIRCIRYTVALVFFAILAAIFAAYLDGLEKSIGTRIFFIIHIFRLKYYV
jgi:hypothetical protein